MHNPNLREVIEVARAARQRSGRPAESFQVSVFAGIDAEWLDLESPERADLDALGVDRLILLAPPPFPLDSIREAGRMLKGEA